MKISNRFLRVGDIGAVILNCALILALITIILFPGKIKTGFERLWSFEMPRALPATVAKQVHIPPLKQIRADGYPADQAVDLEIINDGFITTINLAPKGQMRLADIYYLKQRNVFIRIVHPPGEMSLCYPCSLEYGHLPRVAKKLPARKKYTVVFYDTRRIISTESDLLRELGELIVQKYYLHINELR